MTTETIKAFLDACYQAKRIRELLPALPKGVVPSYIHYLDTIETLEKRGIHVKISDISDALNIPRPGVTRTVKDMVDGALVLQAAYGAFSITDSGKRLSQTYNDLFFSQLTPLLSDISDEDALRAIQTIENVYQVMSKRRISLELE